MKGLDARIRVKIYGLLGLYAAVVLVLMAALFEHQVVRRQQYLCWAESQELKPVQLVPLRGKILDRTGASLAVSIEGGSIFAHPAAVIDAKDTARVLAERLDLDEKAILGKLTRQASFVWIARQLPLDKARAVERLGLKGIGMHKEGRRYYPNGPIAANLLGFAGVDSQGLEGLERAYDKYLRGPKTNLLLQRDARGKVLWREVDGEGETGRGCSLVLTLDLRIQFAAERALQRAVRASRARSGCAVVLDPRTGEVLAMASVPTFNPNRFDAYPPDHWRNRCITDSFEPGSTAKAFLLAAALEKGVVTEETIIHCENGSYRFGGHWIHDLEPEEEMTVLEVITHSSNIGATKIAERLEAPNLWEFLDKFGFGHKTGIDLPGEAGGVLRPWKRWSTVALGTHAFGQGFSVTTLQLATAFAALANGGFLVRPFVVREVLDRNGEPIRRERPRVIRQVLSGKTASRVVRVLEAAVAEGTGRRARIPGYRVAGKTGTAQRYDPATRRYADDRPIVSFVGIVPAEDPEMVVAVVLYEPEGRSFGGGVAAPVFREIADTGLLYRGIGPVLAAQERMDREDHRVRYSMAASESWTSGEGYQAAVWREMPRAREIMPDLISMPLRTALRILDGARVEVRISGSGRVARQRPGAGSPLQPGQVVRLEARAGR